LYEIVFYRDRNGKEPALEFIEALRNAGGKQARVHLNKVQKYIQVLSEYGTWAGMPYVKHIGSGLWELRPADSRFFFVGKASGGYVLLHGFFKKTKRTPAREIEQARREYSDYLKRSDC